MNPATGKSCFTVSPWWLFPGTCIDIDPYTYSFHHITENLSRCVEPRNSSLALPPYCSAETTVSCSVRFASYARPFAGGMDK